MIILQDSNEQKPLDFDHKFVERVSKEKIWVPDTRFSLDYGVRFRDNHVPPFFFERKSISDLFGTMGAGHKRFKRKMQACQKANICMMLIIEGTMSRVMNYVPRYGNNNGKSIIKKLYTLWLRYGLLPIFCKDRTEMSLYITEFFLAVGREHLRRLDKRRL